MSREHGSSVLIQWKDPCRPSLSQLVEEVEGSVEAAEDFADGHKLEDVVADF